MKRQTSLVIDCDLKGRLHEFLADGSHLGVQSCTEHHDLFLVRGHFKDGLYVLSHVKGSKHVITLVENKMLQI